MKEINVKELQMNPMTLIGNEWMLITAGNEENGYNTMTASWGHLGSIWGHGGKSATSTIFVRPQRYTKEFVDREELYTLCFFPEGYREQLAYLGFHSGRDEDKVAKVGLTPVFSDGTTYFKEANLVLICKKLYRAPILEEGFIDKSIVDDCYPDKDFHDMYIGSIEKVLIAE
ncbi:MAG: flavin reductase family protein [Lachnospiraceae bacterium]|nr:flavin reductase family protein [Lachnospiraceae bacterium]